MVHLAAQIDVSEYSDSRKFVQRALQSSFIVAENCEDDDENDDNDNDDDEDDDEEEEDKDDVNCDDNLEKLPGTFLTDYTNKSNLHIAVTDSRGEVVEFDQHGLHR